MQENNKQSHYPPDLEISALAEQFWYQGYLVLEDFFDHDLMSQMQQAILHHFGEDPEFQHNNEFISKASTEVIPWFPQREGHELFDKIEKHTDFCRLTSRVLGRWQSQYSMVMFSKQGTKGQAWHQDCPPEDQAQFNMNRLVYTMDINEETGGQVIIRPFTHKNGALSTGPVDEDFDDQIVLDPKIGTLVLLHGHCWHRITPIKGNFRVSTNYRCAPCGVPEDITDICVYRNMRYQFSTNQVVEER